MSQDNQSKAKIPQLPVSYSTLVNPNSSSPFAKKILLKLYVILKFLDVSDAWYFKYILHQRNINNPSMKDVKTIRWCITSTQLSAGKNEYIHDIQCVKYFLFFLLNQCE